MSTQISKVLNYIVSRDTKDWIDAGELASATGVSRPTATRALRRALFAGHINPPVGSHAGRWERSAPNTIQGDVEARVMGRLIGSADPLVTPAVAYGEDRAVAERTLKRLVEDGKVVKFGVGPATRYCLVSRTGGLVKAFDRYIHSDSTTFTDMYIRLIWDNYRDGTHFSPKDIYKKMCDLNLNPKAEMVSSHAARMVSFGYVERSSHGFLRVPPRWAITLA